MPTTPFMSLDLPTVSTTVGPEWASELNVALETVDSHDHTSGKGVPIPTSGLNINANLAFNSYDATLLRSSRFDAQASPLALVTDLACLYASGVDLWFNDGNGNQIQLTASGALNAASIGGIGGDYATSTASVAYNDSTKTFTFLQDTAESALMDFGTILLRKTTASSAAITIRPDTSLASGWTLTLPIAPPAATGPVMCDNSGNLSFLAAPSATEIGYVTGLTQAAQTQIDRLRLDPGSTYDVGITYAAGTFTVCRAGGGAFGSTNYGSVGVASTTAGQSVTLKVLANATFVDDAGSSDLTNLKWGVSTANWSSDLPFFLYVVNRGNTDIDGADGSSAFFIARHPCLSTTPASADDIGDTGAIPVNDTQNVILILDDVTVANYVSLPCQIIGAFRMQYLTATNDWTVQTLSNTDGVGRTQLQKTFAQNWTMPLGQNGASAGTYIQPNGGTAPVFTNNLYNYMISANGVVSVQMEANGDGGANGAGAVNTRLALPCSHVESQTTVLSIGSGLTESPTEDELVHWETTGTSTISCAQPRRPTDLGGALQNVTGIVPLSYFANGDRVIRAFLTFRGYAG